MSFPTSLLDAIRDLRLTTPLPATLLQVEQETPMVRVEDVEASAGAEVSRLLREKGVAQGERVAIGVGSRGIATLTEITRATVQAVREAGCLPFVFPAMGSHGDATVEGQLQVLEARGVTEALVGAPLRATMEVDEIGALENGPRLYQGRDSAAADHVLLISRVKPHTDFRGVLESGPSKMAVIGLGKEAGAEAMHARGGDYFVHRLGEAARVYAERTNLLGALCLVENSRHEIAHLRGLHARDFGGPAEVELLREANEWLARLPIDELDVLVVREIGKDISGVGMDSNVLGRLRVPGEPDAFGPLRVRMVVALDLSAGTMGHAAGMGLAEVTTVRLLQKIDWSSTYTNALAGGLVTVQRNFLPLVMADDLRALQTAVHCCARLPHEARICLIENTNQLARFWVSTNLAAALEERPGVRVAGESALAFAEDGRMLSPWAMA